MILTDIKQIYPIFKWFKDNYSILNKATQVLLCGHSDRVSLFYNQDSSYYLLYGEITVDNIFSNWLNNKKVILSLPDIVLLHKCLKKNAIQLKYDDDTFALQFSDKEENIHDVVLKNINETDIHDKSKRVQSLMTTDIAFDSSRLAVEIFTPYENNGDLVFKHQEGYEKLIEHPSKKFICTQKEATYSISFSERYDNIRYVAINSYTEKIKLMQIFATI